MSAADQYSVHSQSSLDGYQHPQFQRSNDGMSHVPMNGNNNGASNHGTPSHYNAYSTTSTGSNSLISREDDPFSALPSFPMDAFATSPTNGVMGPYPPQNSHHGGFGGGEGGGISGYAVGGGDPSGGNYDHRSFDGFSNGEVETAGNTYYANYAPSPREIKPEEGGAYLPTNGYARVDPVVENQNGVYQNFPNYLSL